MHIKRLIRKHYEQLYTHKFHNLDKVKQKYKLPKYMQGQANRYARIY